MSGTDFATHTPHEASNNNYILLYYKGGYNFSTVQSSIKECFDNKWDHIKILDNTFYDLSITEKSKCIMDMLDKNKRNYIIFYPATHFFCVPPSLINTLKTFNYQTTFVCHLVDSVDRVTNSFMSSDEFFSYFNMFDYVFTADLYEAKKYGFFYHNIYWTNFKTSNNKISQQYGVFFIGRTKGREKFLFDIALYLQQNNIIYNFYILSSNLVIPSNISSIHILQHEIPYQDVIQQYVHNASCLLSITSRNAHGITASVNEAILYDKKVISTCECLEEHPFYDSRFMRRISKPEDIDIEWLKDSTPVHYDYDKTKFRIDRYCDDLANFIDENKNNYKLLLNPDYKKSIPELESKKNENITYSMPYKDIKRHFPVYRIFFKADCGGRFKDEDLLHFKADTVMEMFCGIWQGNNICTLGSFSYICSSVAPFMHIGRYVSIDGGLSILPDGHPADWISTSPFTYSVASKFFNLPLQTEFGKFLSPAYQGREEKIIIENDVWIGKNVSLQKGIRICNGAIVSHNAVVTTDVPPYAIVSGSPAQVIGFRFKQDIIDRLLELQWWKYNITDLNGLHFNQIELFLEEFAKLQPSLEPFVPLTFRPFEAYLKKMQK